MDKGEALFDERNKKSDHNALEKVWKEIKNASPADVTRNAIAEYDNERRSFTLEYLYRKVTVLINEEKVVWEDGQEVWPPNHLLILHYLVRSRDIEPTGNLVGFKDLEGGNVYWAAFEGRSVKVITKNFGQEPEKLVPAGKKIGAGPYDLGHYAVSIQLFPRVPVIVAVWAGDDEIPPNSNFFFDETIKYQVHTEDVAVVCSVLASMLRKAK